MVYEDPIKAAKLYQSLMKDGYTADNLGSEEEFVKSIEDPTKAKKIYSSLVADGYTEDNLGSEVDFLGTFTKASQPEPVIADKKKVGKISYENQPLPQEPFQSVDPERQKQIEDYFGKKKEIDQQIKNVEDSWSITTSGRVEDGARAAYLKKQSEDYTKSLGKDGGKLERLYSDFKDLPEGNKIDFAQYQNELDQNEESYTRHVAALKWQRNLADAIVKKDGADLGKKVYDRLIQMQKFGGTYSQRKRFTDEIIKHVRSYVDDTEKQEEIIKNIAVDRAASYGSQLAYGSDEELAKNPMSEVLNKYQIGALEFLQSVDPVKANAYAKLLNVPADQLEPSFGDNTDMITGYESQARELESIGLSMALNSVMEDIKSLNAKRFGNEGNSLSDAEKSTYNKLVEKFNELDAEVSSQGDRYPTTRRMEVNRMMQEAMGESDNGIAKRFTLNVGKGVDNTFSFIETMGYKIFGSDTDLRDHELRQLGASDLYSSVQSYVPNSNGFFQQNQLFDFSTLQPEIDAINNSKLSYEEKQAKMRDLMYRSYKDVKTIQNPEAGKINWTGTGVLEGMNSVISQMVPMVATAYLMPGSTASKAAQFRNMFTSSMLTTYEQQKVDNIRNKVANPETRALMTTVITSAAEGLNLDLPMFKKMFTGKGGILGKIASDVTEADWNAVVAASKGGFKNNIKRIVSATGANLFETIKESATEEIGTVTDKAVGNVAFGENNDMSQGLGNDFVITLVGLGIPSLAAVPFRYSNTGMDMKYGIWEIGTNADKIRSIIKKQVEDGVISHDRGKEWDIMINRAENAVNSTPPVKANGKMFTDSQKAKYAYNEFVKQETASQSEKAPESVSEKLAEVTKVAQEENDNIASGKDDERIIAEAKNESKKSFDPTPFKEMVNQINNDESISEPEREAKIDQVMNDWVKAEKEFNNPVVEKPAESERPATDAQPVVDTPSEPIVDSQSQPAAKSKPSAAGRQELVNKLVDRVRQFREGDKRGKGRSQEENAIKIEAKNLGLKYDSKAMDLKNSAGKKVSKRNITTASAVIELDRSKYSKEVNDSVDKMLGDEGLAQFLGIVDDNGRRLSKKQISKALQSVKDGKFTDGSKRIFDKLAEAQENGYFEVEDISTGQKAQIPFDSYFAEQQAAAEEVEADISIEAWQPSITEDWFDEQISITKNEIENESSDTQSDTEQDQPGPETEQENGGVDRRGEKPDGGKNLPTGSEQKNGNQGVSTEEQLKSAQSELQSAKEVLAETEAKIASESASQTDLFGATKQPGMFSIDPEEAKGILSPYKEAVKLAQQKVEDLQKKAKVEKDSENPDIFEGQDAAPLPLLADINKRVSFSDLGMTESDGVLGAIDKIIGNAPEFAGILGAIKADPNIEKVKLELNNSRSGPANESGLYHPVGGDTPGLLQVWDKGNTAYTMVHELMHFMTLDSKAAEEMKGSAEYKALEDIYNFLSSKKGKPVPISGVGNVSIENYGLTNFKEFMAELLINPVFRNYVADVFATNSREIQATSQAIRDSKATGIGELLMNWIRAVINKIFGRASGSVSFDEQKPAIDNAVKIAEELFFGGQPIAVDKTTGLEGSTGFATFDSPLEKIKRYATQVETGEKRIRRYDEETERGRQKGGRRNVEATLLLGADNGESGPVKGREQQEQAIEAYAKAEGIWFGDKIEEEPEIGKEETGLGRFVNSGMESQIYAPGEKPGTLRKAIKISDRFKDVIGENDNAVLDFLDKRISMHNAVAESVPYELIGFARNENGDLLAILEQPQILDARNATVKEIDDYYKSMGWTGSRYTYENDNYISTDVAPKNVLADEWGNLHLIDTQLDAKYDPNENGFSEFTSPLAYPDFNKEQAQAAGKSSDKRIKVAPIEGITPKRISKIIFDVTKATEQRLFFLKPGRRNVSGTYSPGNTAIKIKYANDLDTTAHEIGHSLDDHFSIISDLANSPNPAVEKELRSLSDAGGSNPPKGYPDKRMYKLAEGMAEYVRGLVVNPDVTKSSYSNITKLYDAKVHPEYKKAIEEFSYDVRVFSGAKGADIAMANMQWDDKKPGWIANLFSKKSDGNPFSISFADRLKADYINPFQAFNKAIGYLKGINGIDELLPADDPKLLARAFLHIGAKVDSVFSDGMIDAQLNRLTDKDGNVKNLEWLISPLDNADAKTLEREMQETAAYMIAERTQELAERFQRDKRLTGLGGGIVSDVEKANQVLKDFDNYDKEKQDRIKEAAARYRELADDTLKYMVDKGRLSESVYNEIKENNQYYVGLQRILQTTPDQEVESYRSKGGHLGSKGEPISSIKGSSQTIGNPYTNLIDTMNKSIRESDRNEVLATFREILTGTRGMYEGDVQRFADIGVPGKSGDKNSIPIFIDGKVEHWVFQKDVYNVLKGIDHVSHNLPGFLTALPRLLRWSVTHFPVFAMRNIARDLQHRLIISNENSLSNFLGIKTLVGDSKHWKDVALAGGLNAGFYLKDRAHWYGLMQEAMKRMAKNKKVTTILNPARIYKGYADFLQKGETLNRVAEYRAAFKKGKDQGMDDYNAMLYAGNKSADLIDFALIGHKMKIINQLIPFSNAAVQGLRSSISKAGENPVGFTARMILFTVLPQIVLWYMNHSGGDDEKDEYEDMPDYQRDMFWNMKVGPNNWVSIPKPFELGMLSSGVDRALSYSNGKKDAFDGYGGSVARSFIPIDEAAMTGPLRTLVEVMANYDFFREKSIVPNYEENIDLRLRKTEYASKLGQFIGKKLGFDSRYADHIVRSTLSYYGNFITKGSNIGSDNGQQLGLPDLGFFKTSPAFNSKSVQDFLSVVKKYNISYRTREASEYRRLQKAFFAEKTNEGKDRAARAIREYVKSVIDDLKIKEEDKLLQELERRKKEENKPPLGKPPALIGL